MNKTLRINNKEELQELAKKLGVRHDWHEPDEQEVSIRIRGKSFDNAGFWGSTFKDYSTREMYAEIFKCGVIVAEVNLADLFAFACE